MGKRIPIRFRWWFLLFIAVIGIPFTQSWVELASFFLLIAGLTYALWKEVPKFWGAWRRKRAMSLSLTHVDGQIRKGKVTIPVGTHELQFSLKLQRDMFVGDGQFYLSDEHDNVIGGDIALWDFLDPRPSRQLKECRKGEAIIWRVSLNAKMPWKGRAWFNVLDEQNSRFHPTIPFEIIAQLASSRK